MKTKVFLKYFVRGCSNKSSPLTTSTNSYFWHYVIHYIAKTHICDIDYRRDVSLCIAVWKEITEKESDEKKMKDNKKEVKMLLCISSYYSWKIVINNIYRPWVELVSSVFPNSIN